MCKNKCKHYIHTKKLDADLRTLFCGKKLDVDGPHPALCGCPTRERHMDKYSTNWLGLLAKDGNGRFRVGYPRAEFEFGDDFLPIVFRFKAQNLSSLVLGLGFSTHGYPKKSFEIKTHVL